MSNMASLTRFDGLLAATGPVAVVVQEKLEPVEGVGGVIFPPTFAPAKKGDPSAYVIDELGADRGKVALLDTVGSQANRMEPLFKKEPLRSLVPSGIVKINERKVDVLDMGHRAADAMVRYSKKGPELKKGFQEVQQGNHTELAKSAPTSLVFGCWDSRDTQVKLPRVVGSRIRAFGVSELTRAAQYFSSFDKEETTELGSETGLSQDALSELGFSDAPAGRSVGGVQATEIKREATLNLIALRSLGGGDEAGTLALQRYILGLALVALLSPMELYLREGCLLTSIGTTAQEVPRRGNKEDFAVSYEEALAYAQAAAAAFGVGPDWEVEFSKDEAKQALTGTKSAKGKKEKAKG